MIWIASFAAGAGIGLAWLGGLRLTVHLLFLRASQSILAIGSSLCVRLALLGAAFATLSAYGGGAVLAGVSGLWLARWCVIRHLLRRAPYGK